MRPVLVVGAFGPEIAPFATSGDIVTGTVGIGPVESALGVGHLVTGVRPRAVVFSGTCGSYPGSGLALGDVVVATRVRLADPAECEGRAHLPGPMRRVVEAPSSVVDAFVAEGARPVVVASTTAVTDDAALAAAMRRATGASAEHLEAFSIALASEETSIPFAIVLAVANEVGPGSADAWRANHVDASRRAALLVAAVLARRPL